MIAAAFRQSGGWLERRIKQSGVESTNKPSVSPEETRVGRRGDQSSQGRDVRHIPGDAWGLFTLFTHSVCEKAVKSIKDHVILGK